MKDEIINIIKSGGKIKEIESWYNGETGEIDIRFVLIKAPEYISVDITLSDHPTLNTKG